MLIFGETFFVTCYIKSIQKNVFEVSCKQIAFHACNETARLAQSVEHETLNLRVVGSSPTLGAAFIDKQILGCWQGTISWPKRSTWDVTDIYSRIYSRKSQKPSERFELSTPGLQDQCSNHWATKARHLGNLHLCETRLRKLLIKLS